MSATGECPKSGRLYVRFDESGDASSPGGHVALFIPLEELPAPGVRPVRARLAPREDLVAAAS